MVDTNSGKLFRIALADRGASIRAIDEITGATVPGGDGMLLDTVASSSSRATPRNCRS